MPSPWPLQQDAADAEVGDGLGVMLVVIEMVMKVVTEEQVIINREVTRKNGDGSAD